jgi:hypothetical protein
VQPIAARTKYRSLRNCRAILPHILVAAGIGSPMHLVRILASLHSTVRTAVRVHPAAWISNRFQLAIHLAPVDALNSIRVFGGWTFQIQMGPI